MTDTQALAAAVLVDPLDDLPRLLYADALELRGRPGDADRAMLIRVQVEAWRRFKVEGNGWERTPAARKLRKAASRLIASACRKGPWRARLIGYGASVLLQCLPDRLLDHLGYGGRRLFRATVSRGFVWDVELQAADFWGGWCAECQGEGQAEGGGSWYLPASDGGPPVRCPECNAGHFRGLAGELFRRHPIEQVVITDAGAGQMSDGRYVWSRARSLPTLDPAEVLAGVYDEILPMESQDRFDRNFVQFTLSPACVRYGRKLAGLPALTTGVGRG